MSKGARIRAARDRSALLERRRAHRQAFLNGELSTEVPKRTSMRHQGMMFMARTRQRRQGRVRFRRTGTRT